MGQDTEPSSAAGLDTLPSPQQLLLLPHPRPLCPTLSFAQGRATALTEGSWCPLTRVCLGLCPLGLGDVAAEPDAPVPGSDGQARAQPFAQGLLCLAGPGKQQEKEPWPLSGCGSCQLAWKRPQARGRGHPAVPAGPSWVPSAAAAVTAIPSVAAQGC